MLYYKLWLTCVNQDAWGGGWSPCSIIHLWNATLLNWKSPISRAHWAGNNLYLNYLRTDIYEVFCYTCVNGDVLGWWFESLSDDTSVKRHAVNLRIPHIPSLVGWEQLRWRNVYDWGSCGLWGFFAAQDDTGGFFQSSLQKKPDDSFLCWRVPCELLQIFLDCTAHWYL